MTAEVQGTDEDRPARPETGPVQEGGEPSPGVAGGRPVAGAAVRIGDPLDLPGSLKDLSRPGRRASSLPPLDVPQADLPAEHRRSDEVWLPEVGERDLVRHYTRLAQRNYGVDTGFYPLGSCTMKHNPRFNERVAALPGHARLHPAQDPERAQGALR